MELVNEFPDNWSLSVSYLLIFCCHVDIFAAGQFTHTNSNNKHPTHNSLNLRTFTQ